MNRENIMGKVYVNPMGYLSMNDNTLDQTGMYDQLKAITDKYGSAFYLKQSKHPFNTQTNEALNQSQACQTPKNKVFHSSKAFHHRHAIMVGTHNWGFKR